MRYTLLSSLSRLSLFVVSLLSVGCSTIHYQITLKPDGDEIERTLVCWRQENRLSPKIEDFPIERLNEIAIAYSAEPQNRLDQKHTFSDRFTGKMPNDIGNSGTYTRWVSPFGTASMYLERLVGSDDVSAQIKSWEGGANRGVDLLIAWLDSELKEDPKWKELRTAIDTKARHDFVNLANIVLVAGGSLNSFDSRQLDEKSPKYQRWVFEGPGSVVFRLFQYLVERGYLDVSEIPVIARFSTRSEAEFKVIYKRYVERLVRQLLKLKDSEPIPSSLEILTDAEAMSASLDKYLRSRPEYEVLVALKKKGSADNSSIRSDEIVRAIILDDDKMLGDMFRSFQLFVNTQRISVDLSCPVRPVMTNGVWDRQSKQIRWKTSQQGSLGLPAIAEAIWSEPNIEEQTKRFGEVILTGDKLVTYAIWYAGLKKEEAKEWDAFVETWKPGPELIQTIEAFRFTFDRPIETIDGKAESPSSLADIPRGILVEALKKQRDGGK